MANMCSVSRVIACLDGPWYNTDGKLPNYETGNHSNIHRISSCVKEGIIIDEDGRQINQICRYFSGKRLGKAADSSWKGVENHILEVLKYVRANTRGVDDEVWLFGFGGGALVACLVADLLCRVGDAESENEDAPETKFREFWSDLLKRTRRKSISKIIDKFKGRPDSTFEAPTVQFLGLFGTDNDIDIDGIDEMPFSASVKHIRHAVSLNEDQKCLAPVLLNNSNNASDLNGDSLIEAWFLGTQLDIGGGVRYDGLSLYPLQWILVESRNLGLHLKEPGNLAPRMDANEDIIQLVFPSDAPLSESEKKEVPHSERWVFKYSNGVTVDMYDLRASHNQGNLQAPPPSKLTKSNKSHQKSAKANKRLSFSRSRSSQTAQEEQASEAPSESDDFKEGVKVQHVVKINKTSSLIKSDVAGIVSPSQTREPFVKGQAGELLGYYELAASGSIVHPSVFFLMNTYRTAIRGDSWIRDHEKHLKAFRVSCLPALSLDPWVFEQGIYMDKSCRILVCGGTGVGKSTLLNCVFGIPMTATNDIEQTEHDVNLPLESDYRPGIIIHDSCGFEYGDEKKLELLMKFIKKRSTAKHEAEQLDAIWVCIEAKTPRPFQKAVIEILKSTIPVIVVFTKKDDIVNTHSSQVGNSANATAMNTLSERKKKLEKLVKKHRPLAEDNTRIVYTSKDDLQSIQQLLHETLQLVEIFHPSAMVKLTAAQVADAKQKIKQGVKASVNFICKGNWSPENLARTIPLGDSILTPTLSRLLCEKVVQRFGFPRIRSTEFADIMTKIIFGNLTSFMVQSIGQDFLNWAAVFTSIFTLVGIPPLLKIWPAARMMVKCGTDLIIVLDGTFTSYGVNASSRQLKQVLSEYMSKKDADGTSKESRREKVHKEIGIEFPMKKKFYQHLHPRKAEKMMRRIIIRNRLKLGKAQTHERPQSPRISEDSGGMFPLFKEEITALPQVNLGMDTQPYSSVDNSENANQNQGNIKLQSNENGQNAGGSLYSQTSDGGDRKQESSDSDSYGDANSFAGSDSDSVLGQIENS